VRRELRRLDLRDSLGPQLEDAARRGHAAVLAAAGGQPQTARYLSRRGVTEPFDALTVISSERSADPVSTILPAAPRSEERKRLGTDATGSRAVTTL
jgi:hypothetical protein